LAGEPFKAVVTGKVVFTSYQGKELNTKSINQRSAIHRGF